MTTETAPDPTVEAWSDNLEEELVEAGMEQAQAKAYRHAFELGLTRVISQTATRQELQDGLAELRQTMLDIERRLAQTATKQELLDGLDQLRQQIVDIQLNYATKQDLKDAIAGLRNEMRFLLLVGFGIVTALLSAILAVVA